LSTGSSFIIYHVFILIIVRAFALFIAAGFKGLIYCSKASPALLPLGSKIALKVVFTPATPVFIKSFLDRTGFSVGSVRYLQWVESHFLMTLKTAIPCTVARHARGNFGFMPIVDALRCELPLTFCRQSSTYKKNNHDVVFLGDLGPAFAFYYPQPKIPYRRIIINEE